MNTAELKQSARRLLEENILQFWLDKMVDHEHGGFYGRMDGNGHIDPLADKGCVLNARILWTFSSAYRVLSHTVDASRQKGGGYGCDDYLQAALRARDYLVNHFIDEKRGGVYWSVDYKGQPLDMKKQTYAIGFAIYGLSEFVRATGDKETLACAVGLFEALEAHAYDAVNIGYIEAQTFDWQPISDMRLSYKDENGSRTMNTHLHVLEPYTNLLRCLSPGSTIHGEVSRKLRTLITIFTQRLLNPRTCHLDLFFDDRWQGKRNIESYGHDIEAAWLLTEALEVLGDDQLTSEVMPVVGRIAIASEDGLMADGSMIHERNLSTGQVDADRHWWVQCENVIGQINQHQHFAASADRALEKALACYRYIEQNLVDRELGEWYWSVRADGTVNRDDDHAGFWKCPYHNSRMCLEILERNWR